MRLLLRQLPRLLTDVVQTPEPQKELVHHIKALLERTLAQLALNHSWQRQSFQSNHETRGRMSQKGHDFVELSFLDCAADPRECFFQEAALAFESPRRVVHRSEGVQN